MKQSKLKFDANTIHTCNQSTKCKPALSEHGTGNETPSLANIRTISKNCCPNLTEKLKSEQPGEIKIVADVIPKKCEKLIL